MNKNPERQKGAEAPNGRSTGPLRDHVDSADSIGANVWDGTRYRVLCGTSAPRAPTSLS